MISSFCVSVMWWGAFKFFSFCGKGYGCRAMIREKKNVALIHNLYYLKVLKLQKGGGSHQWRTLQMFLEQSEASCWNVFPLHEEARAATLLATPARVTWLGSCDRGELDQWVWQLTVTAVRSCQPGLPTRARATDLSPEEERRRPSSASDIWSLPHTWGGYKVCRAGGAVWWKGLRSPMQMDTYTHVHAPVRAHCATWLLTFNWPAVTFCNIFTLFLQ